MVLRSRAIAWLLPKNAWPCSRRDFSCSSSWRRKGLLTTFPPTSNPELDAIILKFRDNAFLPNHLSQSYREMVYRPKFHFYLTGEEPVTVKIPLRPAVYGQELPERESKVAPASNEGGRDSSKKAPRSKAPAIHPRKKKRAPQQEFTLMPLLKRADIPNTRKNYKQMLALMSASDFDLVPEFLHELKAAGLPVDNVILSRTARRGAELDRVDVVIRLFGNVQSIGIPLNEPEVVSQVMLAVVRHASNGFWTKERLDEALNYADSVLIMLGDSRHRVESNDSHSQDAGQLPHAWGITMALEAIRSLRYGSRAPGPHSSASLSALAQSFLDRLDLGDLGEQSPRWAVQNQWLTNWAPVFAGIKYTIQALGPQDSAGLKLQLALPPMEAAVTKATSIIEQSMTSENDSAGKRLGLKMLDDMAVATEVQPPPISLTGEAAAIDGEELLVGEEPLSESPAMAEEGIDKEATAERTNEKIP